MYVNICLSSTNGNAREHKYSGYDNECVLTMLTKEKQPASSSTCHMQLHPADAASVAAVNMSCCQAGSCSVCDIFCSFYGFEDSEPLRFLRHSEFVCLTPVDYALYADQILDDFTETVTMWSA